MLACKTNFMYSVYDNKVSLFSYPGAATFPLQLEDGEKP